MYHVHCHDVAAEKPGALDLCQEVLVLELLAATVPAQDDQLRQRQVFSGGVDSDAKIV